MNSGLKDRLLMAALGFALGAVAMVGYGRMPHRHKRKDPDVLVQKFTKQLGLSDEEQKTVRAALEQSSAKLEGLHEETAAKLKAIRMDTRADIRKVLNPDQQKHFDEMAARWDARHGREEDQ